MSTVAIYEGGTGIKLVGSSDHNFGSGSYNSRRSCSLNCVSGDSTLLSNSRLISVSNSPQKEIVKNNYNHNLNVNVKIQYGLKAKRKRTTSDIENNKHKEIKEQPLKLNKSNSNELLKLAKSNSNESLNDVQNLNINQNSNIKKNISHSAKITSSYKSYASSISTSPTKEKDSHSPSAYKSPLNLFPLSPRFFRHNSNDSDSNSIHKEEKHYILPFKRSESAIIHKKQQSESELNSSEFNHAMISTSNPIELTKTKKDKEQEYYQKEQYITFIGFLPQFKASRQQKK